METVKNLNGKTVCRVDVEGQAVEIVHKGFKTVVRFMSGSGIKVINTPK